jgi:phospholipid-transporting ATPase
MFEVLAICHTVIVEEKKDGTSVFNASSPDELALVNAAKYFGYCFKGRDEDNNMIIEVSNNEIGALEAKYKLLNVLEFNSTRKRMSVIVRTPDDKIKIMCKGADSTILPRLKKQTPH